MANLFGNVIDVPFVNRSMLKGLTNSNPLSWFDPATSFANIANTALDVADPGVDLIPGVGFNEAGRVKGTSTTGSGSTAGQTGTSGYNSGFSNDRYYGSGTATSGSGAYSYDPADLAYLDDQEARLRRQQQSAQTALNNGLTQLGDSYNQEVNSANTRQSRALQDFALKREDTTRAKDSAINRVDTNARTLADSLRRRIGMASGSSSSAYQFAAPDAVSREASKNRTGVVENYGKNFRDLVLGENRLKTDFADLLNNLDTQRKSREADFRAGILERQNQIDGSLAEVARQRALVKGGGYNQVRAAMSPYASAIDSRQSELDGLFNKYRTPFEVKAIDTSTPNLRDYTVDRASINANNTQGASNYSPYGQFLKKNGEDDEQYL